MSLLKVRLDTHMASKGLVRSRSQAESLIKLGKVQVNGQVIKKPGHFIVGNEHIDLANEEYYVSRAGLKLASVANELGVSFKDKIVLDVGSSTGGFTDYALKHGAKKVYAVDVGTEQFHSSLVNHPRIELHEKTDIRDFSLSISQVPDIIVIDVSFISLRDILPHIKAQLSGVNTEIIAMVKPQFEASRDIIHKGVIKNESIRRKILKDFEQWSKQYFVLKNKRDSSVSGAKGNRERFYLLQPAVNTKR